MSPNDQNDVELISSCLKTIGLYISWIDINLVVNDEFFPILRPFVNSQNLDLLQGACLLLKGLVSKGMAPFPDKLSLILGLWTESVEPIMQSPVVAKVLNASSPQFESEDSEEIINLLQEVSNLFGSIGYNLTETYRYGILYSLFRVVCLFEK